MFKLINKVFRRPDESLTGRVVAGGFWVFAFRIVDKIFAMVRLIILARLLNPSDFGLFGLAMLALSILERVSTTGFDEALVQKKHDIKPFLDTAWTAQIVRGLIIGIFLFLMAPLFSGFFKEPQVNSLLKVLSIAVIIGGLKNIGIVYFRKDLEFNKDFAFEFYGTISDFTVSVIAAIVLRNSWALIFGFLARNIVQFVASFLLHPYKPGLRLVKAELKELFDFGRWVFASGILVFLNTQGDDIFVGKFLGASALGFYQIAYRFSNMPATEITHIISKVAMPAYAKLQESIEKIRNAYFNILKLNMAISLPVAAMIWICAPEFVSIFLGEKWIAAIPAIRVLSIFGAMRAFSACHGALYRGSGNPKYDTIVTAMRLCLLIAVIYPLTKRMGIVGTSWAVTSTMLFFEPYNLVKVSRILKTGICKILFFIMPALVASLAMFVPLLIFEKYFVSEWGRFIFKLLSGSAVYLFVMSIMDNLLEDYKLRKAIAIIIKGKKEESI